MTETDGRRRNDKLREDRQEILAQIVRDSGKTVDRELLMQKQAKVVEAAREVYDLLMNTTLPRVPALEEPVVKLYKTLSELEEG